jgi:hypothetical protein
MPTLADIYSAIDSAKRKGSDLIRNPGASLQQIAGYGMDRANAAREQLYQATEEEGIGYGPKTKKLAKQMAESFNPVGIFIGANSATFNKVNAFKAQELEKLGKTAEEIWEQTGTFRGPDRQWRQEISDKGSKITEDVFNQISSNKKFKGPMGQALQHEELYKAYPEASAIPTTMYADEIPSGSLLRGKSGTFQIPQITVGGPSTLTQRSTSLHELQHAIQQKEGFLGGGSPKNLGGITNEYNYAKSQFEEAYKTRMDKNADPIAKENAAQIMSFYGPKLEKLKELSDPYVAYKRLAGEAEARAVQKRRNLTDEQRKAEFPFRSYDVPIKDLILNY